MSLDMSYFSVLEIHGFANTLERLKAQCANPSLFFICSAVPVEFVVLLIDLPHEVMYIVPIL